VNVADIFSRFKVFNPAWIIDSSSSSSTKLPSTNFIDGFLWVFSSLCSSRYQNVPDPVELLFNRKICEIGALLEEEIKAWATSEYEMRRRWSRSLVNKYFHMKCFSTKRKTGKVSFHPRIIARLPVPSLRICVTSNVFNMQLCTWSRQQQSFLSSWNEPTNEKLKKHVENLFGEGGEALKWDNNNVATTQTRP
jgi:hypothetical protein